MRNIKKVMKIVFLSGLFCLGLGISIPSCAASNKPAKAVIKSIKTVSAKKIVVKAKKQNNIKGYQVRYFIKKNMKNAVKRTTKSNRIVVKKLLPETRYFIQVRAYKQVHGKNVYGKWSAKKKVITRTITGAKHNHSWEPKIKTVTIVEDGYWLTRIDKEWEAEHYAWRTFCGVCGTDLTDFTDNELTIHIGAICGGGYYTDYVVVVPYEGLPKMETVWVDEKETYTKEVVTRYKCHCGEKRTEI